MAVTSKDLFNGALEEAQGNRATKYVLALIAALVFAVVWWLPTAKTTVDGWILLLNLIGSLFGNAWVIGRPLGWLAVGLSVAVGLCYSRIETVGIPAVRGGIVAWLGWIAIATSDVVTTGIGVLMPPPDAWPIHQQLAANPAIGIAVVILSTFAPDWIIFTVIRKLFRR